MAVAAIDANHRDDIAVNIHSQTYEAERHAPGLESAISSNWGIIVAVALAVPGTVAAQTGADQGGPLIAFKWLSYKDQQPGLRRIAVESPSVRLRLPLEDKWSIDAQITSDRVSGASPRWHSSVSSASVMSDERRAFDVSVTRYEDGKEWKVGMASSKENDFLSRAVSAQKLWHSDDRNRSWSLGVAFTRDRIGSSDDASLDERRSTFEISAGLTQAVSAKDLVQIGVTVADGRGFYSDPYKRIDIRPSTRRQIIATTRWNHHVESLALTVRTSWRGYHDSFGVRSHTIGVEPIIAIGTRTSITPSLRLYSQTAAKFYFDPVYSFVGAPFPPGYFESPMRTASADHRLAAFGAVTLGLKVTRQLGNGWVADVRADHYEQRHGWSLGSAGSPGLAPLYARFYQLGLARQF